MIEWHSEWRPFQCSSSQLEEGCHGDAFAQPPPERSELFDWRTKVYTRKESLFLEFNGCVFRGKWPKQMKRLWICELVFLHFFRSLSLNRTPAFAELSSRPFSCKPEVYIRVFVPCKCHYCVTWTILSSMISSRMSSGTSSLTSATTGVG